MKTTRKEFDCVQMKWDIQQKLQRQEEGLSVEERNQHAEALALADPILGPWFQRVKAAQQRELAIAEDSDTYGKP